MKKLKKFIMPLILIFVVPLLVNISLCYMFRDGQIKEIPTAVYLGDSNSFTRGLVDYFDSTTTFDIVEYANSQYDIENLIRDSKVKTAIVIPKDFYKDLKAYKSPTILMVYDGTQLASLSFAKISAGEVFITTKVGGFIKYLQSKFSLPFEEAKKIAMSISIEPKVLFNPTRNYCNFLMPGFMAGIVQCASVIALASAIYIRRDMISNILVNFFQYSVFTFCSLVLNIYVQINYFNIPLQGDSNKILFLTAIFSMSICSIGVFISTIMKNKVDASKLLAVLFLPNTIMVGYTWPTIAMPSIYAKCVKYIPFYHYGDALRDFMLKGNIYNLNTSINYLCFITVLFLSLALIVGKLKEINFVKESEDIDKGDNKAPQRS